MTTSDYLGIISETEIQILSRAAKDGVRHPVAALALAEEAHQVGINTKSAARQIARKNQPWLSALKTRLIDQSDFTNSSGALGEIRAYGALLETWMKINPQPSVPGKNVVPEFEANAGDGAVIVEVHSRQLDEDDAEAAAEHNRMLNARHQAEVQKEQSAKSGKTVITTAVSTVAPFGAPKSDKTGKYKEGDSILTNAISRIAGIKNNEKQVDPSKPFVLWLDFQDPTVWGLPIADEQLAPLYSESKDGKVETGPLWFALYGRKGDPMIETEDFTYRVRNMLHDGRFSQTIKAHGGPTRVSAVVYAMPRATVLMENPFPVLPLPPNFRAELLKLPFFCLDRSICEWRPGLVKARIEIERETVQAAAEALVAFNARLTGP